MVAVYKLLAVASVVEHGLEGIPASVAAAHGLTLCCRAQAQYLWFTDLVASQHVESSQVRDQTPVSCIARWILYPMSHQESPASLLNESK